MLDCLSNYPGYLGRYRNSRFAGELGLILNCLTLFDNVTGLWVDLRLTAAAEGKEEEKQKRQIRK